MALVSANSQGFQIAGAMLTDVCRVRTSNEDSVAFAIPSRNDPAASRGCLLLGEVASAPAVEAVRRVYFSLETQVPESLMRAFETANRAILEHGKNNSDCRGMGTTCTALAIHDGQLWLAHVGDSRAYLLLGGKLTQLTADQTLHAQMIREGLMTEEESKTSGGGNVVLRALGTGADVVPDVWEKEILLIEVDTLVLCSDGLRNMVSAATIAEMAARSAPQEACQNLVAAALEAGGHDNVSVGIFALRAPAGPAAEPQKATRRIEIAGTEAAEAAAPAPMIALPEDPP